MHRASGLYLYSAGMSLITATQLHLAFGHVDLLDHTDFSLEENERVGLIGRNGTGKSSLLKILAGLQTADDGLLQQQRDLKVAYVPQEPELNASLTIAQSVRLGLREVDEMLEQLSTCQDPDQLHVLHTKIEMANGWNLEGRVDETLSRLSLDGSLPIATLSGGWRKRVALAQALVLSPDVLLLDEPTNHLDLEAIRWLEDLLIQFRGSVITISHDRAFLDNVCTRMVELDRGRLWSYVGNYSAYEILKAEQLAQEAVIQAKADKLLAQEEVWIRKGVEARRTRSQSRINRLMTLRQARLERRESVGRVRMDIGSALPSGKIVADLEGVCKGFEREGQRVEVIRNFSGVILRGDKVGLVGANGAGKTTLLKLMLGQLQPDSGSIRMGSKLEVAYFDQMREGLNLDGTLEDTISPGSEWIEVNGRRTHVRSYLEDFLFSPQRARSPVRSLSGGERNRLLLARLFARPANVLVLDEPTNDLDIDTLELLEEKLQAFEGTVFLVSHDRRFLDGVVTSLIVHEGHGIWREYEGGIEDWITQSERSNKGRTVSVPQTSGSAPAPKSEAVPPSERERTRKLSYKEQREWEALPSLIDTLEAEQRTIQQTLADGTLYTKDAAKAQALAQRHDEIEMALLEALERWEALEALQGKSPA